MSLSFFWLAVGAGLLAVITPCVFPLMPITAAYFSDPRKSRAESVRSGVFFAIGIILTFSVIGLGVAVTVGASGLAKVASSASMNVVLAIVFGAFGFALHGSRTIALPSGFITRFTVFANRYDRHSVIGPLLLGALFSLTSFTCTTPFVGTLLVLAARDQWITPLAGMLVFSTVFAMPFFVLAVAPGFTQRLPKSGPWLERTKRIVGLIELAAAMKFLSNADQVLGWNVVTRQVVVFAWALFFMLALWIALAGMDLTRTTPALRKGFLFVIYPAAFLFSHSARNRSMGNLEAYLPRNVTVTRATAPIAVIDQADIGWIMNDYASALALAKNSGRLVFVDFTGVTCTNCRWMEANIFARPEIQNEMNRFVRARLYTDKEGEPYESQQAFQEQKFSTVALPLYAIVDANGKTVATLAGLTRSPAEFMKFLATAKAN